MVRYEIDHGITVGYVSADIEEERCSKYTTERIRLLRPSRDLCASGAPQDLSQRDGQASACFCTFQSALPTYVLSLKISGSKQWILQHMIMREAIEQRRRIQTSIPAAQVAF